MLYLGLSSSPPGLWNTTTDGKSKVTPTGVVKYIYCWQTSYHPQAPKVCLQKSNEAISKAKFISNKSLSLSGLMSCSDKGNMKYHWFLVVKILVSKPYLPWLLVNALGDTERLSSFYLASNNVFKWREKLKSQKWYESVRHPDGAHRWLWIIMKMNISLEIVLQNL